MGYKHLTEEERYLMDDMRREGFNQGAIAITLHRSPSTLSRELRRNEGDRGWRPKQAH
jgi:IS30 family transposase